MILAAGLLLLAGLGLFVGGLLTGATAFYWGCVAICAPAAVLLYIARRRIARAEAAAAPKAAPVTAPPARTTGETAPVGSATPAGATASGAGTPDAQPVTGETPDAAAAPAAPPAGEPAPSEPAPVAPPANGPAAGSVHTDELGDPPIEDVEVTDLLLVVDLKDEVLVVDEHPRYHLAGCPHLRGRTTIPLPLDEARADGFTPCAGCAPDRNLADRERARRRAAG